MVAAVGSPPGNELLGAEEDDDGAAEDSGAEDDIDNPAEADSGDEDELDVEVVEEDEVLDAPPSADPCEQAVAITAIANRPPEIRLILLIRDMSFPFETGVSAGGGWTMHAERSARSL